MPLGLNKLEMNKFFSTKSILPNYRFYVTIIDIPNEDKPKIPIIQPQHDISVYIPDYDFKKETQKYGPLAKSFPILDYDGLELSMVLEEDEFGTIGSLVNELKSRIVRRDGLYIPPALNTIDRIIVEVENDRELPVAVYTYRDCFFLKADQTEYNYGGNESVKYTITLNANYYSVKFPLSLQ